MTPVWWQRALLDLLKDCLSSRRIFINIARELDEGHDIVQVARKYDVKPIDSDCQLQLEQRWWLERLFDRLHISFVQGAILIYGLISIPRILLLPHVALSGQRDFQIAYFASFGGDLFVAFALLLIHSVQKGSVELGKRVNENLKKKKYVSPPVSISEENLNSDKKLEELDEAYQNLYVKPVMCKPLQLGFDLAFEKSYQLGSGVVAAGLFVTILAMIHIFKVISPSVFAVWAPIPEIAFVWRLYSYFMGTFLWFLVGMLSWSLFITFLVLIQVSGNTLKIRPFEPVKEYFQPLTTLMQKTSFAITILVGWMSPYILMWSVFPPDQVNRQSTIAFLETTLAVMIPVIIISFLIPVLKMHKGMDRSRDRALLIKQHQLDQLKKKPISDMDRHLKIQQHLTEDYKSILGNSEWVLNTGQVAQVLATVLLPIFTFLLSQFLQNLF